MLIATDTMLLPIEQPSDGFRLLQCWRSVGVIRALDLEFARFIDRHCGGFTSALQWVACALVSARTAQGHVCLDIKGLQNADTLTLSAVRDDALASAVKQHYETYLGCYSLEQWQQALQSCDAIGASTSETTPLVLAGSASQPLLYLRRYWHYERVIRDALLTRTRPLAIAPLARDLLDSLFHGSSLPLEVDWQKVACALCARSGFSIITGGPGTGKTTTVLRLLALLQGLQIAQGLPPWTIKLAAPTGKAAARLNESIVGDLQRLNLNAPQLNEAQKSAWREAIPSEVSTLHRLLGSRPGSRHFVHDSLNTLPADIVVVDEASMVDVEMMAKLCQALRPSARLILLGDKNQLASVEAGSVLGDLCANAFHAGYTDDTLNYVTQVSGQVIPATYASAGAEATLANAINQSTTMLRHCYRAEGQGILALANWVNEQAVHSQGVSPLHDMFQQYPDLTYVALPHSASSTLHGRDFYHRVVEGYGPYLKKLRELEDCTPDTIDHWVAALFKLHKTFQVLAPVRRGEYGVIALNDAIQRELVSKGLLPASRQPWYLGRPVLVTQNDYSLNLMNGDIGICLRLPGDPRERVAFYQGEDSHGNPRIRWVLPTRLQHVDTVFAMTVHKSQGSEFAHTMLVMPDHANPVLSKELLYTAITRSKTHFTLVVPDEAALVQGLSSKITRQSGLLDA